ncbi:15572_t:CDS:2 [Funneliformis geosporum]|uniref:15572_t:CDS:1 n=1 Tax=Funneliformis geosporum TaxID=1117311 RepID=A0A9W4WX54_9GLOM|nr:15572_t:CDS:2 [Funneliformis geosporum]
MCLAFLCVSKAFPEIIMDYFEQTSLDKYKFIDYYRHRQKQDDFMYSFREESDKLSYCLVSLAQKDTPEIKTAVEKCEGPAEVPRRDNILS